jgi:hypothetical protein
VWLGDDRSTLDIFGKCFVLLRFGASPASADKIAAAATARQVPLDIVDLDHPKAAALYERRLVLVRPDGHVCWRGDSEPEDALELIDAVRGAAENDWQTKMVR